MGLLTGFGSVLGELLKGVEDLPALIVAGGVDLVNGFFSAVAAALNALIASMAGLGLTMPALPSIPQTEGIGWLNWVYPVGDGVAIVVGAITVYVIWLGIRYLFNLLHFGET
jgi:hypothetical protein